MIFQNWINWVWVLLFVNCYYSYSISKNLTFNNDNIEIEFDDKYLVFDTKLVKRKGGHASSGHGSSGSSGSSGHGSSGGSSHGSSGGSSHGSSGGSEGSGGSSGGSSGHTGNSGNSGNSGSSGSSGGSRGHVGQDISSSGSGYSSGSRGQSGENAISGGGSRGHQTGYSSRGNYYTSNTGIKQHGNYNGNPVYSYSSRRSSYSSTSRYTPRYFVGGLAGGAAAGYLLGSGFGFYHWGYYPYYPFGYHYYHHSNTTNEQITNFEPLVLSNSGTSMLIDLQIGNEKLIVQLDTSSSDLWFIDSNNVTDYEGEGLFTISDSTKSLGTSFTSTNYDNITGDYYSDTILVNDDFNLTDFQFAVVDLPSSSNDSAIGFAGVLGIGPKMGESSYITEGETYDNFIFKCYNEKLINKPVYSIYLNTSESEIGSFLLGAVDIAKILDTDNFITLPLTSLSGDDKNISSIALTLSGLQVGSYTGDNETTSVMKATLFEGSAPAVIDTSSTFSYLPPDLIDSIATQFNFEYEDDLETYTIDCDKVYDDYFVEFNFQGVQIDTPLSLLVSSILYNDENTNTCMLNLIPSDSFNLGLNILRSMYFTVDLQENEISIANVNYENLNQENYKIVNSTDSIPSAQTNDEYSSTWKTDDSFTIYNTSIPVTTISTDFPGYFTLTNDLSIDSLSLTGTYDFNVYATDSSSSSSPSSSSSSSSSKGDAASISYSKKTNIMAIIVTLLCSLL